MVDGNLASELWREMVYRGIVKCMNEPCTSYANETGLCSRCRKNPSSELLVLVDQQKNTSISLFYQNEQRRKDSEKQESERLLLEQQRQRECKHCSFTSLVFKKGGSGGVITHDALCSKCRKLLFEFYETEDSTGTHVGDDEWYGQLTTEQKQILENRLSKY